MASRSLKWRVGSASLFAVGLATAAVGALGTGRSFETLHYAGYQQELYGVVELPLTVPTDPTSLPVILGGVAFAPLTGDVWATECRFGDVAGANTLHRFVKASSASSMHDPGTLTLHEHQAVTGSPAGCGIVNHPTPGPGGAAVMYSNTARGIVRFNANSGAVLPWAAGADGDVASAPGNGLGIAVDPSNNHLVYVGKDCHPRLSEGSKTCTIYDFDPAAFDPTNIDPNHATRVFAQVTTPEPLTEVDLPRTAGPDMTLGTADDAVSLIDGIYFDPNGQYLFAADRSRGQVCTFNPILNEMECEQDERELNRLTVFARPSSLQPVNTATPFNGQMVRRVAMTDEPDGVAFATEGFVVTLNEKGGTMTRFDFPANNYTQEPAVSIFASGGFRGDLLQVGPDGCIYATQGRHVGGDDLATRYDNGTTSTEDSIVRICKTGGGGFEPPPGVSDPPATAHLKIEKHVTNDNGGSASASDFTLSAISSTDTVSGLGGAEDDVAPGVYTLSESSLAGYAAGSWSCTGGTLVGNQLTLAANTSVTCSITNDDQPAHLQLVKYVSGGSVAPTWFTLSATKSGNSTPSVSGPGGASGYVNAGTYALSETTHPAYTAGAWSCTNGVSVGAGSSISLGLNQSTVCSITNTYVPPPADSTSPVCGVVTNVNPPYMWFQDSGSGIVRLDVITNLKPSGMTLPNFSVNITGTGAISFTPATVINPSRMAAGTVATFAATTAQIRTYATRIDTTKAAQLTVKATDVSGLTATCDPVATTVTVHRKMRHERGNQTFVVPPEEHVVTIINGDPGLRALDVVVNGVEFRVRNLPDNGRRVLDVRSAMHPGDNTITLIPRGKKGDSADVYIQDTPWVPPTP